MVEQRNEALQKLAEVVELREARLSDVEAGLIRAEALIEQRNKELEMVHALMDEKDSRLELIEPALIKAETLVSHQKVSLVDFENKTSFQTDRITALQRDVVIQESQVQVLRSELSSNKSQLKALRSKHTALEKKLSNVAKINQELENELVLTGESCSRQTLQTKEAQLEAAKVESRLFEANLMNERLSGDLLELKRLSVNSMDRTRALEKVFEEKSVAYDVLEKRFADSEALLNAGRLELSKQKSAAVLLEEHLLNTTIHLNEVRAKESEASTRLQIVEAEFVAIKQSLSWRLTSPLRGALNGFYWITSFPMKIFRGPVASPINESPDGTPVHDESFEGQSDDLDGARGEVPTATIEDLAENKIEENIDIQPSIYVPAYATPQARAIYETLSSVASRRGAE